MSNTLKFITLFLGVLLLAGCQATKTQTGLQGQQVDWAANMKSCLAEYGWEIETRPDGGVTVSIPEAQKEPYNRDFDECENRLGYDVPVTYSESQLREIYAKVVEVTECIRVQGHEPGQPPSEQTFIDQVQTGQGGWDPYSDIYGPDGLSEKQYFELLEQCPRSWN